MPDQWTHHSCVIVHDRKGLWKNTDPPHVFIIWADQSRGAGGENRDAVRASVFVDALSSSLHAAIRWPPTCQWHHISSSDTHITHSASQLGKLSAGRCLMRSVCGWKQLLKTSGKFMLRSRVQAWRWEMMKKPEDSANNEWLQCTKSPALRDCRRPPGGKIKSILTLFKFTNTKSCQPSDDQQCFQLY